MGTSVFKAQKTFDKDTWVITIFNMGAADSGHAALLVEGEDEFGQLQVYLCHIGAHSFYKYLERYMAPPSGMAGAISTFHPLYIEHKDIFEALRDTTICYVLMQEPPFNHYPAFSPPLNFSQFTSTSWQVPRLKAETMIDHVGQQVKAIDSNTRRSIEMIQKSITPDIKEYFEVFKRYGHESILMKGDGINCVNWCDMELKQAGIKPIHNVLDSSRALPEEHAAQRRSGMRC